MESVPAEIASLRRQMALLEAKLNEANRILNSPDLLKKRLAEVESRIAATAPAAKTVTSYDMLFKDYPREQLPMRGQNLDRLKATLLSEFWEKNFDGHLVNLPVVFDAAGRPVPISHVVRMTRAQQREAEEKGELKTLIPAQMVPAKVVVQGLEFEIQIIAYCDEKLMPLILKLREGSRGQVTGKISDLNAYEGDARRPFRVRMTLVDVTLK